MECNDLRSLSRKAAGRFFFFFQAAKVVGSEALGLSQRLLKHREQFLGSPNKMEWGGGGGW